MTTTLTEHVKNCWGSLELDGRDRATSWTTSPFWSFSFILIEAIILLWKNPNLSTDSSSSDSRFQNGRGGYFLLFCASRWCCTSVTGSSSCSWCAFRSHPPDEALSPSAQTPDTWPINTWPTCAGASVYSEQSMHSSEDLCRQSCSEASCWFRVRRISNSLKRAIFAVSKNYR